MASFEVKGNCQLQGSITPQGAKNEALQVICATLLTCEEVVIDNVPDILDVKNLIDLLRKIGVEVKQLNESRYSFKAECINRAFIESTEFLDKCAMLRGSLMLIGPLLNRLGQVYYAKAGGDKIGRRRLDTHFNGIRKLGGKLTKDSTRKAFLFETNNRMQGTYILLDEASVTGTANIVMAAVMAQETTTIYNAACVPSVQQLCRMLNNMGARITGIATNLLTIKGVDKLHGTNHRIQPDILEVGSFIGMAAMTCSELTIKDVPWENLGLIPDSFSRLGITLEQHGNDMFIPRQEHYKKIDSYSDDSIMTLADAIWPGFPSDLLSILLTVATQANGNVLIHEKMFESRLFFVDKLIDMGAQIILCDPHRAVVIGQNHRKHLKANDMVSPDVRAGFSMLIAAMSADGVSHIYNIEQIDRGYAHIEKRLNAIGANITRTK